ncbi:MAG: hypothetical protein RLZZ188_3028, partial [Verrucomicrobiota bacterium]
MKHPALLALVLGLLAVQPLAAKIRVLIVDGQ